MANTKYRLIQDSMSDLEDRVNDYLKRGWKPLGGPCKVYSTLGRDVFAQALIKEDT